MWYSQCQEWLVKDENRTERAQSRDQKKKTCQIPGPQKGAGLCKPSDQFPSSAEGGAVDEERSSSHPGMADPVPGNCKCTVKQRLGAAVPCTQYRSLTGTRITLPARL